MLNHIFLYYMSDKSPLQGSVRFLTFSQGDALGWDISPLWGF